MRKLLPFTLLLSLCLVLSAAARGASAADTRAAAHASLSADQARDALAVLRDNRRRAEVENTLRAIIVANGRTPDVAGAAAASDATPASAAAASSAVANTIVKNGLIAQLFWQVGRWTRESSEALRHFAWALLDPGSVVRWWRDMLGSPAGSAMLLRLAGAFVATLSAGLIAQWLAVRAMARPRRRLAERSAVHEKAANRAARANIAAAGEVAPEATGDTAVVASPQSDAAKHAAAVSAGMAPVQPGQIPAAQAGASAASVAPTGAAAEENAEAAERLAASAKLGARRAEHHWYLLQRLPFALAGLGLALVPLVAFAVASGLVASLFSDNGEPAHEAIVSITTAYVVMLVVLTITDFFVSARCATMRLVRIDDASAAFIHAWMIRLAVTSAVGAGLTNAAAQIGLNAAAHEALLRITALVVHAMLVVIVLRSRLRVAEYIRANTVSHRALSLIGTWLADVWSIIAIFVIVALWVVWALNVQNGYEKLFNLALSTVAVLVGARVVAIVVFGGLGRIFHLESTEGASVAERRAYRYYPLLRSIISALIGVATFLALLEVWGFHILDWFVHGSVGRKLTSAFITIALACMIAVLVWESTNITVERRLEAWTSSGDTMRAARLRTLLPMFRTILFVVIALVIGLTALNEIGVNTAPLLAGASIIGVALGFGSQKLVQDFITGIFLLMENAMQVGDWVTVAGVSGSVEYLSIRTVRLRAGDGSLHTVPFSSVSTVNNTNRGVGNASVRVSIAYDEDVERAIAALRDIGAGLREDPAFSGRILADFDFWGVDAVDGSGITLAGQIRTVDSGRWPVQREFNRRILDRFRALGIRIADAQRSLLTGVVEMAGVAPKAAAAPSPGASAGGAIANGTG
jgi:small-conductance mechanosensitive channel